jgi:hypothetical protein
MRDFLETCLQVITQGRVKTVKLIQTHHPRLSGRGSRRLFVFLEKVGEIKVMV